jgi:hypothetical protein
MPFYLPRLYVQPKGSKSDYSMSFQESTKKSSNNWQVARMVAHNTQQQAPHTLMECHMISYSAINYVTAGRKLTPIHA